MHHSGLATITERGIRFSSDLLTPLSIRNGTHVWATYYPTPQTYGFAETYHDLMMTAVPYDCWLFSGRFRALLQQQAHGGLHQLINIFKDNGMSIIYSEASRSGHRYATCTTTVCVDSLMCEYNSHNDIFTPELIAEIKKKVSEKINQCVQDIQKRCQEFLFCEQESFGLEISVRGERLDSLSYFYQRIASSKQRNERDLYCKPWRFTCKDGLLYPGQETVSFIKAAMSNSLPSRAFAEINTRDAQLRLAVIPTKKLQSFAWVVVSYQWHDPDLGSINLDSVETCSPNPLNRNIISEISQIISRKHNIWRFFTHIRIRERDIEEGNLEFFVSLLNNSDNFLKQWERLKSSLTSYSLDTEGAKIIETKVTPIAFKRVFLSTRTNLLKKGDFLNVCEEVGSRYGMLPRDFRTVETYIDPVISSIVTEIRSSHAMIQYYGDMESDPTNYDWLHAELLAAKVLGMPVVTIVEGQDTPREWIRTLGDQTPIKIPKSPSREDIVNSIEKALKQIHGIK